MPKAVSLCAIAYVGGVFLGRWQGLEVSYARLLVAAALIGVLGAVVFSRFLALTLLSLALSTGFWAQSQASPSTSFEIPKQAVDQPVLLTAWVLEPQRATARGVWLRVAVFALEDIAHHSYCLPEGSHQTLLLGGDLAQPLPLVPGDVVRFRAPWPELLEKNILSQRTPLPIHTDRAKIVRFADPDLPGCATGLRRKWLWLWSRPIDVVRQKMLGHVGAVRGTSEARAFLAALCLGWRGAIFALDQKVEQQNGPQASLSEIFHRAGVSHILSVSGLHLSLVGWLVFFVLARFLACIPFVANRWATPRLAAAAALPFVAFYTQLTGAELPTVRAACVLGLWLAAKACGRRTTVEQGLALAVLLVGGPIPKEGAERLFDPGWLLSLAATLGLVYARPLAWLIPKQKQFTPVRAVSRWLLTATDASFGAFLATVPLVALFFGRFVPTGLLTNVLLVPLGEFVVLPLGLLGGVLCSMVPTCGEPLLSVAAFGAGAFIWVTARFAALGWSWPVMSPSLICCLLFFAGLVVWSFRRGPVLCLLAVLVYVADWHWPQTALKITVLSVGQGDSLVLEFPNRRVMVVDAGPAGGNGHDAGRSVVTPFLRSLGVAKIDWLVLSHAHPDHSGGIPSLLREFSVGELWIAPLPNCGGTRRLEREHAAAKAVLAQLGQLAEKRNVSVLPPRSMTVGEAAVEVLDAKPPGDDRPCRDLNNDSTVLRVSYKNKALLLTGDIEAAREEELQKGGATLRADVLKAPHHCSRTSSTPIFLQAVLPQIVLCSVGRKNRFGFPAPEVVARYTKLGSQIFRTDEGGSVCVSIQKTGELQVRRVARFFF